MRPTADRCNCHVEALLRICGAKSGRRWLLATMYSTFRDERLTSRPLQARLPQTLVSRTPSSNGFTVNAYGPILPITVRPPFASGDARRVGNPLPGGIMMQVVRETGATGVA